MSAECRELTKFYQADSVTSGVTSVTTSSAVSDSTDTRTKAELWNEVKMLSAYILPPIDQAFLTLCA